MAKTPESPSFLGGLLQRLLSNQDQGLRDLQGSDKVQSRSEQYRALSELTPKQRKILEKDLLSRPPEAPPGLEGILSFYNLTAPKLRTDQGEAVFPEGQRPTFNVTPEDVKRFPMLKQNETDNDPDMDFNNQIQLQQLIRLLKGVEI